MHAEGGRPLGLLVLMAGCGGTMSAGRPEQCAPFAELEVTNPDGAAPADVIAEVHAALDQFEDWTGREGVCVAEARLVPEIVSDGRTVLGRNHEGWIEIVYNRGGLGFDVIVRHELCHAVDREAGWFSETRPDWFPPPLPHEELAYLCDEGPQPVSLTEAIEDTCGIDLLSARQGYINDEIYAAVEVASEPPVGTLPITLERRALTGLPEEGDLGQFAAGGSALVLSAWSAAGDDAYVISILVIEPASAAVVGAVEGPIMPRGTTYTLLPSDEDPLLVYSEQARAWTVDTAAGALTEMPFPRFERVLSGAVLDGAAWVTGTAEGEAEDTFSRVDLATGARTVIPWPEGIASWSPAPDGAALSGLAWDAITGRSWLAYAPDTGTWTRAVYPAGWNGMSMQVTLPDGRVVATWMDLLAVSEYYPVGLAVIDPATGAWWLPDAPCADDAISLFPNLLSIGGEPWLLEYGYGFEEGDPFRDVAYALTRVVVPDEG